MDDLERYVEERKARDPEFRQAWEDGAADLAFQKAIIGARLAAGLSQKQLAERIGTSQSAVARMEAGAYRPRVETLLKLAEALDITFQVDGSGVHVHAAQPAKTIGVHMSLASPLEAVVRSYVDHKANLEQLQAWLDAHVQETADTHDSAAVELSDRVWILLGELSYGERTEDDVRTELSRLVPVRVRQQTGHHT